MIKLTDKSINVEIIIRVSRAENYSTETLAGARQDVNFIFSNFSEISAYIAALTNEVHNRVNAEVKRLAHEAAAREPEAATK